MLQPRLIRVRDDKSFSCHLTGPEMSRYLTNTLLFNTKLKRTSLVFLIAWGVGVGWSWGIAWFSGGTEEGSVLANRL